MENNKYYTPQIEEFCVGFECEFKHYNKDGDEVWEKRIISVDIFQKDSYEQITYSSNWRVKYLDKDDFLDLDFIFYGQQEINKLNQPVMMFHSNEFNIMVGYYYKINKIVIATKDPSKNEIFLKTNQDPNRISGLLIKNKSEFKKLLKQLEND